MNTDSRNLTKNNGPEKRFLWLFLAVYTAFLIVLIFRHEQWRDEAQSYLLIRDLSFPQLFRQLKIEGHPLIWYLILFPFIKLGCPIVIQNVISALCGILSAYLILFKLRPSIPFANVILLFSSPVLYYYSMIARNYSAAMLAFLFILSIFPERYGKHSLAYAIGLFFLVNISIYSAIMAGALVLSDILLFFLEKGGVSMLKSKKFLLVLGAMITAGLLLLLTIYPGDYYSTYQNTFFLDAKPLSLKLFWESAVLVFRQAFLSYLKSVLSPLLAISNSFLNTLSAVLMLCLPAVFLWKYIMTKERHFFYAVSFYSIFMMACAGFVMVSSTFKLHHGGLVSLVIWFSVWIGFGNAQTERHKADPLFFVLTALLFVLSSSQLFIAAYDMYYPYSGSLETANYIKEKEYDNSGTLLLTTDASYSASVLVHLDQIKQTLSRDGRMSFADWKSWSNPEGDSYPDFGIEALSSAEGSGYEHILLLVEDGQFETQAEVPYPLLFSNREAGSPALVENFDLYQIK